MTHDKYQAVSSSVDNLFFLPSVDNIFVIVSMNKLLPSKFLSLMMPLDICITSPSPGNIIFQSQLLRIIQIIEVSITTEISFLCLLIKDILTQWNSF